MTEKLLADMTESLIAALVLDKGLYFATKLFEVCILPKLAVSELLPVCCQINMASIHRRH